MISQNWFCFYLTHTTMWFLVTYLYVSLHTTALASFVAFRDNIMTAMRHIVMYQLRTLSQNIVFTLYLCREQHEIAIWEPVGKDAFYSNSRICHTWLRWYIFHKLLYLTFDLVDWVQLPFSWCSPVISFLSESGDQSCRVPSLGKVGRGKTNKPPHEIDPVVRENHSIFACLLCTLQNHSIARRF